MVSDYLKSQTVELHQAAEKHFQAEKIFHKNFTIEDYKRIIGINSQMLMQCEQAIFEQLKESFSESLQLSKRQKLSLIEKDILELSLELSNSHKKVEIESWYEALGMLYVIEGSTLGGNVIAKHLANTDGFQDLCFNFYGCYGKETGLMWRNFKETLDASVPEKSYSQVLTGAKKIYSLLLSIDFS